MNKTKTKSDEEILNRIGAIGASPMTQLTILKQFRKNVVSRISIEALSIIPKAKHEELKTVLENGSLVDVYDYLRKYIPNIDIFIMQEEEKEIEETKKMCIN